MNILAGLFSVLQYFIFFLSSSFSSSSSIFRSFYAQMYHIIYRVGIGAVVACALRAIEGWIDSVADCWLITLIESKLSYIFINVNEQCFDKNFKNELKKKIKQTELTRNYERQVLIYFINFKNCMEGVLFCFSKWHQNNCKTWVGLFENVLML